jgi:hypothetical protein
MSKNARHDAKSLRRRRNTAQKSLRALKSAQLMKPRSHTTRPNRSCCYESVKEEKHARTGATVEHTRIVRAQLPVLLGELREIPDPRKPVLIRHKLLVAGLWQKGRSVCIKVVASDKQQYSRKSNRSCKRKQSCEYRMTLEHYLPVIVGALALLILATLALIWKI